MKQYPVALLALLASSCAYHYSIGVQKDGPAQESATLVSDFSFDIAEIDGVGFKEKFNFSAVGTNTIRLPPGRHTVKFKYCECSLNSQRWTEGFLYVSREMEAGRKYRMKMVTIDRRHAKFEIVEASP